MTVSAYFEIMTFLVSLMTAGVLGINYDFFRAARKEWGKRVIWDILMWTASVFIVVFVWFFIFFGQVRWYMIIALISGLVLYFFMLSKYVFLCMDFLLGKIRAIFCIIFKILLTPPRFLCKIIRVYSKGVRSKFPKKVEEKNDEKKA